MMGVLDGERYLRTAVESVLTQSFPDFEFLIVDDASADTTRQILGSPVFPKSSTAGASTR